MPRQFRRAYDQAPEPQFCKAGVWARRIARPVLCECRILVRPVRLPDGARRTPPAMRGNCDAARRASGARTWPRPVGAPRGVRHAARPAGERPLAPGAAALARAPDRPAACGIAERPGKRWRAASTRTRFLGRESCMPRKVLADSMRRHAPSGFPQKKRWTDSRRFNRPKHALEDLWARTTAGRAVWRNGKPERPDTRKLHPEFAYCGRVRVATRSGRWAAANAPLPRGVRMTRPKPAQTAPAPRTLALTRQGRKPNPAPGPFPRLS